MNDIHDTLEERGNRYGTFVSNACTTQRLKQALNIQWDVTVNTNVYAEALEMICHKMSRIVNGDPSYEDSWRDIAGYAQLVVDHLNAPKETNTCNAYRGMQQNIETARRLRE